MNLEYVKEIQLLLNKNGFHIEVDGIFGPETKGAVRQFQIDSGLKADSVPGPLTLGKLRALADLDESEPINTDELDFRTKKYLATLDPKAQIIFLPFIKEAKQIAANMGVEYFAVSGNRTWAEQDELYAQGRTKPGPKVTNARGGQSSHNFKIAMDFGCFKDGKYLDDLQPNKADSVHKAVGKIAGKYDLDWGGNWTSLKDWPHFEVNTGLTLAQKRKLFSEKGSVL